MGSETGKAVVSALSPVGAVTLGTMRTKKIGKQPSVTDTFFEGERAKNAQLQKDLADKVARTQKKLAAGQARANRSRLRGGVFGESEPTLRNLNKTLG